MSAALFGPDVFHLSISPVHSRLVLEHARDEISLPQESQKLDARHADQPANRKLSRARAVQIEKSLEVESARDGA